MYHNSCFGMYFYFYCFVFVALVGVSRAFTLTGYLYFISIFSIGMRKVDAVLFGLIRDVQHRDDLTLLTDSQDVQAVKDYLGAPEWFDDFGGCFVKIGEGDYEEIYCFEGCVPLLDKSLYKVEW